MVRASLRSAVFATLTGRCATGAAHAARATLPLGEYFIECYGDVASGVNAKR